MKMKLMWLTPVLALALAACPGENGEGAGEGSGEPAGQVVRQLDVQRVSSDGSTATYEVRIDGGPASISAFGLDISFDPAQLAYSGWEKGELTSDFTQVGANAISEGTVRVAGFTAGDAVPAGATGVMATLEFEVTGAAPERLSIASRVDDLKAFSSDAD